MIVELKKLLPPSDPQPPESKIAEWTEHYSLTLKKYGYDDRSPEAFGKICRYFAQYWAGIRHLRGTPADGVYAMPERGLILFGPCGTGKTTAMMIMSGLFDINFVGADELVQQYAIHGESGFWEYARQFKNKPLVIDDITGEREIKSYGNDSIMVDFIVDREKQFKYGHVLTFFTTNAPGRNAIKERYGNRALSRILGMCDGILLAGKDSRFE